MRSGMLQDDITFISCLHYMLHDLHIWLQLNSPASLRKASESVPLSCEIFEQVTGKTVGFDADASSMKVSGRIIRKQEHFKEAPTISCLEPWELLRSGEMCPNEVLVLWCGVETSGLYPVYVNFRNVKEIAHAEKSTWSYSKQQKTET